MYFPFLKDQDNCKYLTNILIYLVFKISNIFSLKRKSQIYLPFLQVLNMFLSQWV